MNGEIELRLQAFLDGELAEREMRHLERQVTSDEETARLLDELRWTKSVLAANEPETVLPESREFYWSKIQREILRTGSPVARESRANAFLRFAWKRCLAPGAGFALALMVVWGIMRFYSFDASGARTRFLAQVESPSEEMGAVSFRSQSENVFVIWLYKRSGQTQSEISLVKEMVIQ